MSRLTVGQVFVPGQLPEYTYNPREEARLEETLRERIQDGGSIICVSGLTKMGKTVLVEKVLSSDDEVWVDGSQFTTIDEFWLRVGDRLGVYPSLSVTSGGALRTEASVDAQVKIPMVADAGSSGTLGGEVSEGTTRAVTRPISAVALEAIRASGKSLVIDDFHFINRGLQREVVRTLKQPVFKGLRVVVISTSHRTLDVILAEPNMDGRAEGITVSLWDLQELEWIAAQGFQALNLFDPGGAIGKKLAEHAFGSPHLMQKFCKAVCRVNGINERPDVAVDLREPSSWDVFFRSQVDGVAERWFERLVRGAQERGTPRTKWVRRAGGSADTYALIMEALTRVGSNFEVSKDQIKSTVDGLVEGTGPAADKITRAMQKISSIASRPLEGKLPDEADLDDVSQGDTHFVLEYVDQGPNSKIHLTDPFFAYYLMWGDHAKYLASPAEVPDE